MILHAWLRKTILELSSNNIPTPGLDAVVLLAELLHKDRSWLHAHPEHVLQDSDLQKLNVMVDRRKRHEPIAYIIGKQEFYGRDFIVSPDTLTPRPETETMIELFLETVSSFQFPVSSGSQSGGNNSKLSIIDVGTGSGCIIISLALELNSKLKTQNSKLFGLDISKPALEIAKENAKKHKVDIDFIHFDLFKDNISKLETGNSKLIILANLPYVPYDFKINLAATHEPKFAIYGGGDGLDYYRALFLQLANQNCNVFTEALPPQHSELKKIAKNSGFKSLKTQDFIQVFEKVRS